MGKNTTIVAPKKPSPRLTLWSYLSAQITTPMQDELQANKHERVYNFLHVPQKLEQVNLF